VRSFDDASLSDPRVAALISRMEVIPNDVFTTAFTTRPQRYCARVTVVMRDGSRVSAESGGDDEDLAAPKDDAWVSAKFRAMTEGAFDNERSIVLLRRLWRVQDESDVANLPSEFVLK
jgi:2-methylcitrate dehydratase PrpD